jgi:hypothetical protein
MAYYRTSFGIDRELTANPSPQRGRYAAVSEG